jgi:DNA-binding cell septation regulator SpoVG
MENEMALNISVKWSDSGKTFTVNLGSDRGDFLAIKGCRIASGKNGDFVSWPSKKMDDGKYFNYAWASEAFANAVLDKAEESMPRKNERPSHGLGSTDDDVPF